jgi:hypothetical protein
MKMGIILDLIVLAIVILSIILGYKRGLISVVFNLCAFVVSLIITVILYTPISNWVINNTEIDENIKNSIIENGMIEKQESEENDGSLNTYIQKYVQDGITDTANNAIEQTAGIIAEKVIAIIVAIGLFIVVRIAMILLKVIIGGIANLPIIKQFDKLGGTIYGVLVGFFIVYVLLAILFFIVSVNNNETILNAINSSIISKILYANNIILNIIF